MNSYREGYRRGSADAEQRIRELEAERDARVSVELLNVERETCDRIRSDNDGLRKRIRELEAKREFIEELKKRDDQ